MVSSDLCQHKLSFLITHALVVAGACATQCLVRAVPPP